MSKRSSADDVQPRYPYTTKTSALRRLLAEIPKRPRPGKVTLDTLKTWGVTSTNDASPIRVLKDIGMLSTNGEPPQAYLDFMLSPPKGPRALGGLIRAKYAGLFETSHEPHKNHEVEVKPQSMPKFRPSRPCASTLTSMWYPTLLSTAKRRSL
jgi:hypothetical protein